MKKFLKILIMLFILLSAIFIFIGFWLKTDPAKKIITNFVQQNISEQLGIDAKITNLNISLPIIITAENIIFSEENNDIITINNFYLNLVPSLFSFWEIVISEVSAKEIYLHKIPQFKESIKESKIADNNYGAFNPNILIKKAYIKKIVLEKEITSQENDIIFSLDSNIKFNSQDKQINFEIITKLLSSPEWFLGDNSLEVIGLYNFNKEKMEINSLELKSNIAKASGKFLLDKSIDQLSGNLKYETNILESILSSKFSGTKSNISGEVKLSGSSSSMKIKQSGNVIVDLPQNDYLKIYPISWNSELNLDGKNIDGNIKMKQNNINLDGNIGYRDKKLYIKNMKAIASDFEKIVNITFDPNSSIIIGAVSFSDKTLKETSKILPFVKSGSLSLNMIYSSPDNKTQHVSAIAKGKQLNSKFGRIGAINFDINLSDLWNLKFAKSKIDISYLNISDYIVKNLSLDAHSIDNKVDFAGSIKSNQPHPIDLKLSSLISINGNNAIRIDINELSGKINSSIIKNSKDIKLNFGDSINIELDNLKIGDGFISADTELSDTQVKIHSVFKDIPFQLIPVRPNNNLKEASISGSINLSGSKLKPNLKSDININKIAKLNSSDMLNAEIIFNISEANTNLDIIINDSVQKFATLSANLPSKFSLSPFAYEISKQNSFKAALSIDEPFDLLSIVSVFEEHDISGIVSGKLNANGNLNNPNFSGTIKLSDGKYSYDQYGIALKNITTNIVAKGNEILFNNISANDILNNRLDGFGYIVPGKNNNFNLNIKTNKFDFINTPYIQGDIKGNLDLNGDKDSAKATGEFVLESVEIKIPEHFQENIPELNIKEIITNDETIIKKADNPYILELDVKVKTGKKVYVRGWGVDTELKGKLDIKGDAGTPLIYGSLKAIRGKYSEFGKVLKVKEGVLTFDGPISPSPYLNIVGVYIVGDNEIRLILSGSLLDPDITLESTPEMSQEDALSMLLFGENPSDISAFQALQLADSVRRLSGHGGGFDILGMGRKILGVDNIDFKADSAKPENSSVGVGKHLTNMIYFEIERGRSEGSTKSKIEVQITPKISIENTVEQEGNTSVGINWRFDY